MSKHTPLSAHHFPDESPALLVNGHAPRAALMAAGDIRLQAVRDLLETVALAADDSQALGSRDARSVAWAAHLLTADALDLYQTAQVDTTPARTCWRD